MSDSIPTPSPQAAERFDRARRKVFFDELLSLVRGRSPELLSFEAVQSALRAWQQVEGREPQVIALGKIVGSVGRYRDFTREFLPKDTISRQRWLGVDAAMQGPTGLPPIEVYQVGDVYFVRDGHHRVSVARANGFEDIEAYVTKIETPVRITADTRPEDLVLKAAYANFLRQTHLDTLRPDAELEVTEIGSYLELLQHIQVHRHYLGVEQEREISDEEAVISWYDKVYLPVAAAIWASNIMEQFPGRTAADLYLWVCRHREDLAQASGTVPSPVAAVTDLVAASSDAGSPPAKVVKSVKKALGSKKKGADLAAEATRANRPSATGTPAEDETSPS
jgi:hypothetical protein